MSACPKTPRLSKAVLAIVSVDPDKQRWNRHFQAGPGQLDRDDHRRDHMAHMETRARPA